MISLTVLFMRFKQGYDLTIKSEIRSTDCLTTCYKHVSVNVRSRPLVDSLKKSKPKNEARMKMLYSQAGRNIRD